MEEPGKKHLSDMTELTTPKMGQKHITCLPVLCTEKNTSLLWYLAQNLWPEFNNEITSPKVQN